jgi:uncharacterized protein (TIRG00374 family)
VHEIDTQVTDAPPLLVQFKLSKLILPILLGLGAVAFLFYSQFDLAKFREIHWSGRAFAWIGLAFFLLLFRHLCYTFRLRAITKGVFSWRKCLELMVLWEFSSTITPTSKGGPFVMLFVLTREKLEAGRTAAAVFYVMLCDNSFFVITLPIMLAVYGPRLLSPGMVSYGDVGLASGTFFVTYTMMCGLWLSLMFFLLFKPRYTAWVLDWLGKRKLIQKYAPKLSSLGAEFSLAAEEIRRQDVRYHAKAILGTLGAWTCKFLMINCLMIAVYPSVPFDGQTQVFIYGRLLAMFIIMSFSPTPGGAGLAEIALVHFISDYVPPAQGFVVALLWRGMAYYGYLLAGAILVPAWISKHISTKERPPVQA